MESFETNEAFEEAVKEWLGDSVYDDIVGDVQSAWGVKMLIRGPFEVAGDIIGGVIVTEWDSGRQDIDRFDSIELREEWACIQEDERERGRWEEA